MSMNTNFHAVMTVSNEYSLRHISLSPPFLRFQQLSIVIWIEKQCWDDCVLKYIIIKSYVLLVLP